MTDIPVIDLKELTNKYKIVSNEIAGEFGEIYAFGGNRLGVYSTNKRRARAGLNRKDWTLVQNGDYETTYSLPSEDLAFAARMVGAKRVKGRK